MATKKSSYFRRIETYMKTMRTYRPEYRLMIDKLAGMLHQYDIFEKEFAENGYKLTEPYTNKAGATNDRKVPTYTAMETLRRDILTYSDRLFLNPKSVGEIVESDNKGSSLGNAIKELTEALK